MIKFFWVFACHVAAFDELHFVTEIRHVLWELLLFSINRKELQLTTDRILFINERNKSLAHAHCSFIGKKNVWKSSSEESTSFHILKHRSTSTEVWITLQQFCSFSYLHIQISFVFGSRFQDLWSHHSTGGQRSRQGQYGVCFGGRKSLLVYWCRGVCSYVRSTEEQVWMYGAVIVLGTSAESPGEILLQW